MQNHVHETSMKEIFYRSFENPNHDHVTPTCCTLFASTSTLFGQDTRLWLFMLTCLPSFHLDHASALPYVLAKTNFRGRVFMTHPTKAIYKWLIQDSVRVQ